MGFLNYVTNQMSGTSAFSGLVALNDGINNFVKWGYQNCRLAAIATANNSVSLDITNIAPVNYRRRFFVLFNSLSPVTNGALLRMRFSNDNGVTWLTTGYESGFPTVPYNSTTLTGNNSTTFIGLSGAVQNSPGNHANGYVEIMQLDGGVGSICCFTGLGSYWHSPTSILRSCIITGDINVNNVNAIQILFSTGNIASGECYVYNYLDAATAPP